MKKLIAAAIVMSLTAPAFAQSSQNAGSQNPQARSDTQKLAAAQKIKQDLKSAGFTDINVVAESFVVQAKSPDGDPVVMTIGPHGMSVFEAMKAGGSSSGTTGLAGQNSNTSNPNPSTTNPKSGTQK